MIYIMKIIDLTNNKEQPLEYFTTWRDLMRRFSDFVGVRNYKVVVCTQEVQFNSNVIIEYSPNPELI